MPRLRGEQFRRDHQRVDAVATLLVRQRQDAPLLDQRARQGFCEQTLGQAPLNGSLVPVLPASSLAVSVSVTSAPA